MAQKIVDWQAFPDTDRIYLLDPHEVVVSKFKLQALLSDMAHKVNNTSPNEHPLQHEIYLKFFKDISALTEEAIAWNSKTTSTKHSSRN